MIKYITCFSILLTTLVSCVDLDEDVNAQLAEPSIIELLESNNAGKAATINRLKLGVFAKLQDRNLYSDRFMQLDVLTDNAYPLANKLLGPIAFSEHGADNEFITNFWYANYRGINEANYVIDLLESRDLDPESVAQLKFVRNLLYLNLVPLFGDVPYYKDYNIVEPRGAVRASEIYQNVIDELKDEVIPELPVFSNNLAGGALPTKQAAMCLLIRAYMYSVKENPAITHNDIYTNVVNLVQNDTDINLETFLTLSTSFNQLFQPGGERSSDILFSVQFDDEFRFNQGDYFSSVDFVRDGGVNEIRGSVRAKRMVALENFVDLFKGVDPNDNSEIIVNDNRLDFSVFKEGDFVTFGGLVLNFKNDVVKYPVRKYLDIDARPKGDARGEKDFIVLRKADILLLYAEALFQLGTDKPKVLEILELVRGRVGNITPDIESINDIDFEFIMNERRKELAFEGVYLYDLIRWGKLEEAFAKDDTDAYITEPSTNKLGYVLRKRNANFDANVNTKWPIPNRALIENQNLLIQNPGY